MSHPDHARWQQCWRDKQTGFHLAHVHPLLQQFWPALGLAADDRVFVPLCGKSRDLMWLRALGHHVTGVELSPVAVRTLFKECVFRRSWTATPREAGHAFQSKLDSRRVATRGVWVLHG